MPDLSSVDTAARASVTTLATSVAGSVADARVEAEKHAETDPTYAEMMLTYVELGELLEQHRHVNPAAAATMPPAEVQQDEDESRTLAARLVDLERPTVFEQEQWWARWCSQNMDKGAS